MANQMFLVNRKNNGASWYRVINGEHIATKGGGVRWVQAERATSRVARDS